MQVLANGLRYLRWGGDGEAVQPEKGRGVGKCLKMAQNPQRQVHAMLVCPGFGRLATLTRTTSFDLILHAPQYFTSPTLPTNLTLNWKNAKAKNLLKPVLKTDFAKKITLPEKMNLTKCLDKLDN